MATPKKTTKAKKKAVDAKPFSLTKEWLKDLDARVTALEKKLKSK